MARNNKGVNRLITPKMAKNKPVDKKVLPKGLGDTLRQFPHIETVYVNEKGDYHFVKRAGFNPIDREDVLGEQAEEAAPDADEAEGGNNDEVVE